MGRGGAGRSGEGVSGGRGGPWALVAEGGLAGLLAEGGREDRGAGEGGLGRCPSTAEGAVCFWGTFLKEEGVLAGPSRGHLG